MTQDYANKARALRAKAADKAVSSAERDSLLAKARELEAKYGSVTVDSTITDETTITGRDGRGYPSTWDYHAWTFYEPPPPPRHTQAEEDAINARRRREAWDMLWNLHREQERWNRPPDDVYNEQYDGNDPQETEEDDRYWEVP